MNKILSFLFSLCILIQVHGQASRIDTSTARKILFASAQKMASCFVNKAYDEYVNLVHPKLVTLMGGKAKFTEVIKQGLKETEEQGFRFVNVTIAEPSDIVIMPTELQSVVPQILEMKATGGRIISTSYLIAISSDIGKTWYFIDSAGKDLKQLQSAFPSLSNKLVLPEKPKPVFYKE